MRRLPTSFVSFPAEGARRGDLLKKFSTLEHIRPMHTIGG